MRQDVGRGFVIPRRVHSPPSSLPTTTGAIPQHTPPSRSSFPHTTSVTPDAFVEQVRLLVYRPVSTVTVTDLKPYIKDGRSGARFHID